MWLDLALFPDIPCFQFLITCTASLFSGPFYPHSVPQAIKNWTYEDLGPTLTKCRMHTTKCGSNTQYVGVTNLLPRHAVSDFVLQFWRNKIRDGNPEYGRLCTCIGESKLGMGTLSMRGCVHVLVVSVSCWFYLTCRRNKLISNTTEQVNQKLQHALLTGSLYIVSVQ